MGAYSPRTTMRQSTRLAVRHACLRKAATSGYETTSWCALWMRSLGPCTRKLALACLHWCPWPAELPAVALTASPHAHHDPASHLVLAPMRRCSAAQSLSSRRGHLALLRLLAASGSHRRLCTCCERPTCRLWTLGWMP